MLRDKRLTSPEPLAVADFAADALVLAQAAQEADLGGEDAVVGDLEQQLLTWDRPTAEERRGVRIHGRRKATISDGKNVCRPSLKLP